MKERPSPAPEESAGARLSRRELLIRSGYLAGSVMLAGPLAACGTSSSSGTPTTSSSPKKGGNFRLGVTGGGAKDFIDGQTIVTKPDQARLVAGFETLMTTDSNYNLTKDGLAEEVTQDAPDKWTIRLRKGIEFHNGKTLSP